MAWELAHNVRTGNACTRVTMPRVFASPGTATISGLGVFLKRRVCARKWWQSPCGILPILPIGRALQRRHRMGEKSVGAMKTDSTLSVNEPLTSDAFLASIHAGSSRNALKLAAAASLPAWARM